MSVNPLHWFGNRELEYTPKHFTIARTPLTEESKLWILNTLTGRFSVFNAEENIDDDFLGGVTVFTLSSNMGRPAFEDPTEAVFYELTWS
jgi:hypothetical protein